MRNRDWRVVVATVITAISFWVWIGICFLPDSPHKNDPIPVFVWLVLGPFVLYGAVAVAVIPLMAWHWALGDK